MPALLSVSFLVEESDILALTSKGDELVTGHILLGKGQEGILVKEGGIKGVRADCMIYSFSTI